MSAKRNRWSVRHRVRSRNLTLSKRATEAANPEDHAPVRIGARYTVVMRGGKAVLHLLSDYYTDAVLEAARGEDIEPLGTRGHTTSIPLFLGDLYVGEVNYPPNGNQKTVEAIERNVKNYTAGSDSGSSLTLSTQPVIPQEIADKGVEKARRGKYV